MGSLITLLFIVVAMGGRLWFEFRQFDRLSADAALARSRNEGSSASPLDATYHF